MIHKLVTDCREHCFHDWYFVPLLNPDGYEYAMKVDESWVKNRDPQAGDGDCVGVYLDLNFESIYSQIEGGSHDPCAWNFYGTERTAEVRALSASRQIPPYNILAISFLKTGKMLLYPYANEYYLFSYTYESLGEAFFTAINDAGNGVRFGRNGYSLYNNFVDGTSIDECAYNGCADHCLVLLLRDDGSGGNPPSTEIMASTAEMIVGVNTIIDFIENNEFT